MEKKLPTELAGDKLRKALAMYAELRSAQPERSPLELIDQVSRSCDLSPLESDFLQRQLKDS